MSLQRGVTILEALVVMAILMMVAAMAIPAYVMFARARAVDDAATTLAQDISMLERMAQNDGFRDGATLQVVSGDPLSYAAYRGLPQSVDARSSLRELVLRRVFDNVRLAVGPVGGSPLYFAGNGGAFYITPTGAAARHQAIRLNLISISDPSRTAVVNIELFTGAVSKL